MFCKHIKYKSGTIRWTCSKKCTHGCAMAITSFAAAAAFVVTRSGNPAVRLGGQMFWRHMSYKSGNIRWTCSKKCTRGCAMAITSFGKQIIKITGLHNHY